MKNNLTTMFEKHFRKETEMENVIDRISSNSLCKEGANRLFLNYKIITNDRYSQL